MSDEDFEPFVGGPPPDPSERTWRHPSEIAAEARSNATSASGRRGTSVTPPWRPGSTASLLVAGSLGAVACLTAIALFPRMLATSSGGTATASFTSPALPVTTTSSSDGTGSTISSASSLTDPAAPLEAASPAVTVPGPIEAAASRHLVSVRADANTVVDGVLLDGYLFTSADSVDHRLSVTYQRQGHSTLAYLVGIDRYSDLAVFRPSGEVRASNTIRALTTGLGGTTVNGDELSSQAGSDQSGVGVAAVLGPEVGDQITVASLSDDDVVADAGVILAADSTATTPSGQPLIGLLDTSARRPSHPGSLLLDDRGGVVGIVVDTSSSLASALPADAALAIADRLTEQGWANETWIGFMGIDRSNGVEVVDVTDDGPAARAGMQPGDLISFLDGAPIEHMGGIAAGLRRASPGDFLLVLVHRDGELLALRIEAAPYPVEPLSEPVGG